MRLSAIVCSDNLPAGIPHKAYQQWDEGEHTCIRITGGLKQMTRDDYSCATGAWLSKLCQQRQARLEAGTPDEMAKYLVSIALASGPVKKFLDKFAAIFLQLLLIRYNRARTWESVVYVVDSSGFRNLPIKYLI